MRREKDNIVIVVEEDEAINFVRVTKDQPVILFLEEPVNWLEHSRFDEHSAAVTETLGKMVEILSDN